MTTFGLPRMIIVEVLEMNDTEHNFDDHFESICCSFPSADFFGPKNPATVAFNSCSRKRLSKSSE